MAPPGVNISKVVEVVANQIASTIIHEAAHGKRWAEEYYTNKQSLSEMNRSEEEGYAEEAEQRANFKTQLTKDIYDESEGTDIISNQEILNIAIRDANSKNDFYIPTNAVEDVSLDRTQWGEFEMIQTPGFPPSMEPTSNPHMAWDEQSRKLKVDVDAIVEEYNKALEMSYQQQRPSTIQDDGVTPDVPGVSQQPPNDMGVPSVPAIPGIGAR
jgi:hypothetical protein